MQSALERGIPEAVKIFDRLKAYNVETMTDHYVCGQFDNIQNGLEGKEPSFSRPALEEPKMEIVR
jgi:hypothetical protein